MTCGRHASIFGDSKLENRSSCGYDVLPRADGCIDGMDILGVCMAVLGCNGYDAGVRKTGLAVVNCGNRYSNAQSRPVSALFSKPHML
jgi:hypothetical protein